MSYHGDLKAGQTVRLPFNTVDGSQVPTTLSAGSVAIAKDGADISPSGGVTLTVDQGSITGRHVVVIDTSIDPTSFSAGSNYSVRLAGTSNVGGTSVVGMYVGSFSIQYRSTVDLNPTRAALLDNLDVAASAIKAKTDLLPASPAATPTDRVIGTVDDTSPTASSFKLSSGLSSSPDFYTRGWLVFTSGALQGIPRKIASYAADHTASFGSDPFPTAPANSDSFEIIGRAPA